jgi:hypothetical protein
MVNGIIGGTLGETDQQIVRAFHAVLDALETMLPGDDVPPTESPSE